jgi:AcrR family transcriptional regulator
MTTTAVSTESTATGHAAPEARARDVAAAILESGTEQFSRCGFHGASMRQLAEGAGVTLSNVYNYFPAKSDILLAILRRAVIEQIETTTSAIESAGPSVVERYLAGVESFVLFDLEHLDVCFVANSELRYLQSAQRAEIVELRDRQQALYEELIEQGVALGTFRTPHPGEAATAMLMMCVGVTVWYRPEGPLSAAELARRYARYALAMVEGT